MKMRGSTALIHIYAILLGFGGSVGATEEECERLQTKLTYRQEEAPRDLSGLLPVVVERVNKVLEGVVDVEVEWTGGDLHGRVGEHIVQCRVTRLASDIPDAASSPTQDDQGRLVATQCFHVPFSILDTNECTLPRGHVMRHKCSDSAICINTIGSYECVCPRVDNLLNPSGTADDNLWTTLDGQERSSWELSFNSGSRTTCPGVVSTHGCCPERAHTKEGSSCRAKFQCPADPCAAETRNNCARSATCVRQSNPQDDPNYTCRCPSGLMGNGRQCTAQDPKPQPKVMFDGVTPTEETVRNQYYCDCTKPIVDACSGFPPCQGKHEICSVTAGNVPQCTCKTGYVKHEKYGCVDESPPLLRLKNDPNSDQTMRLKQGDVYQEYAVDIQDENAEEYLRSLKITYSQPLPQGCLTQVGEFHVNYTVATPWTSPPYVRITRRVIIEDMDECRADVDKLRETCPELIPQCDVEAGAVCVNTVGSYTCKCPKYTSGDGFLSGLAIDPGHEPEGYRGGTSCRDTSKPVIVLKGPNPHVFRVCACDGLSGIMGGKRKRKESDLRTQQQRHYDDDIKELVRSTHGAELCATHSNRNPSASDCVNAYDETFRGRIDLSRQVVVGEPIKKSTLLWSVPYNVQDQAGNAAVTVWRDVVVEEVALDDLETKIRADLQRARQVEIDRAVSRALEEDRRKREPAKARPSPELPVNSCPACTKCDCANQFDPSLCDSICKEKVGACAMDEQSFVVKFLVWLEQFVPPSLIPSLLGVLLLMTVWLCLRFLWNIVFRTRESSSNWYANEERQRMMQNSVTYYQENGAGGSALTPLPPRTSMSVGGATPGGGGGAGAGSGGSSLFTPQSAAFSPSPSGGHPNGSSAAVVRHSVLFSADRGNIYASPIITPSQRGDGVRRRSPYTPGERY